MFDFNSLLNDVAPVSPMLLPVDFMIIEKNGLLIDYICVLLLISWIPPRPSAVSVVFVFNKSLNDVVPLSPMSLSVDLMRMKRVVYEFRLCVVNYVDPSDQAK